MPSGKWLSFFFSKLPLVLVNSVCKISSDRRRI
jgi:hypothetical protein